MTTSRDPDRLIHAFLREGAGASWTTRSTTRSVPRSTINDNGSSSARGGFPP